MEYFKLKPDLSNLKDISKNIAIFLKKNKVGVIPTETFYALAVNPFSETALEKLIFIKNRPKNKPILLLISNLNQLHLLVKEIPPVAKKIIEKFWPGPLTIVFPAKKHLSPLLTGGTQTIGVRLSSSVIVKEIIESFGNPITGTSANLSNKTECKNIQEVLKQLKNLDFVLDAGELKSSAPSTIISVINNNISLIRLGIIPFEEILKIFL